MVQKVRLRLHARPTALNPPGAPRSRLSISGAMSANAISRRYPQTEGLFEQLHIDRRAEGYESVDELAWRHGVDVRQFLEQLRQTALNLPRS